MTSLPTPHPIPLASSERVAKPTGFRDTWAWNALQWGGIWLAACLIFASQNAIRSIVRDQPVDWFVAFWVELLYWVPWFVMTPLLLGAARRWPLGSGAPRSNLAWHLLFMVAFSLVQVVASDALQFWAGVSHGVFTEPNRVELAVTNYTRSFPALAITAWWKYWVFMGCRYAFDYHRRFREREVVAAQLEAQLATAQLQALRMQLHPHFLFNALHSAAMLTMIDPERAHKVLVQLSALLRTTLDRSSSAEVALSEEMDFVDRYLAIERVRFQDRLRVEIEADDDALAASVPNLILQPLVENAVRHGIARRTDSGALTIRAARTNGTLVLEVQDDGEGLPNAWTLSPPHGTGVGLTNVRSRLERIYGSHARLELLAPADASGKPTRGTLARVTMPYRKLSAIGHQPSAQPASYQPGAGR